MKTIITVITLLLMTACSDIIREPDERRIVNDYREICLNGVVYYSGHYRLTPKFKPDSTVETCN